MSSSARRTTRCRRRNRPLPPEELRGILRGYRDRRRAAQQSDAGVPVAPPQRSALEVTPQQCRRMYEAGWRRGGINALSYAFTDFFTDERANFTAQEFAREKIRQIVRDPVVADALCPAHHIGTKRTCVDIGYFETYNRDHVELVDVRASPITAVTPGGLATTAGEYRLDVIVFAVGFDAITGALLEMDIRGRDGESLAQKWSRGPHTYLGLCVAGFPNLFMITGPGSPSVLSNMVVSIEQHVDWIAECLGYLAGRGMDRIEASAEAEDAWVRHVDRGRRRHALSRERRRPGTSGLISPASRGCSCPTSGGAGPTGRSATRSSTAGTGASSSRRQGTHREHAGDPRRPWRVRPVVRGRGHPHRGRRRQRHARYLARQAAPAGRLPGQGRPRHPVQRRRPGHHPLRGHR